MCPTAECKSLYVVKRDAKKCLCSKCKRSYCPQCRKSYHRDTPCAPSSLYVHADLTLFRPCPVCRQNVRRVAGCKSMTCGSEICQGEVHFCMCCARKLNIPDEAHDNCITKGYDFVEDRRE